MDKPHVALVGLRCSGKSAAGKALARRRGSAFVDLDVALWQLARAAGASAETVGELWLELGEARFRDFEEQALAGAVEAHHPSVIATGGGAVERPGNRVRLARRARIVWLDAPDPILAARLRADSEHRPSVLGWTDPTAEFAALRERRALHYSSLAERRFDTSHTDPEELARCLDSWLEASPEENRS